MDARGIEKKAEQHSAATAEWGLKEINRNEEASELKPLGMNTTTEVFEPGGGVAEMTPTRGNEAKDKFLFVAKPPLNPLTHSSKS